MTMKRLLATGLLLLSAAPAFAGPAEDRLAQAVRANDLKGVRAALAAKPNVNALLPDKSTVLAWAVDRQNEEAVRLLLAAGAQPRPLAPGGAPPLALACELGNPTIVTRLITAGADAKQARPDGASAFSLCAGASTPTALTAMAAKGAAINGAGPEGQTPLMWAAMYGKTENINWLLKRGAQVNVADKQGFTPLFFALRSKKHDAAMALLHAGANVNAVLADGTSVLQAAVLVGNLPFAIQAVTHGADVKRVDKDGKQFIHLAAATGDAALVKAVLAKGVDPNVLVEVPYAPAGRGGRGAFFSPMPVPATPLQFAARAGSVEAMKALVAAGAKPDIKGPDGMTTAVAAAGSGKLDAMQYAYELDPHLDVIMRGGRSLMHVAVAGRMQPQSLEVIQFLVDKGAPLAIVDDRKDTPGDALNRGGDAQIREFYIKLLRDRGIVSENH
jgi:ankyrin repeat protein